MGCQGGRGSSSCVLGALLVCALAWASPAHANTITVDDVHVGESGKATFTLTRAAGLGSTATAVSFQTSDGSAGAPGDYVAASGSRSFGSALLGATQTQQVEVAIQRDALDEPDETFRLTISGAEVTDGIGIATISDDDPPPSLSVADSAAVTESAAGAKASFAVRLSAPSGRAVSVAYATADAGATAGQDYTARSGTLVLPAGSTQALVDVAVIDDSADEPAESFELRLASPVSATIGDGVATATILDDDEPSAPPPAAGPGPAAATGSGSPQSGPSTSKPSAAATGSPAPTTGSSTAPTSLGLSGPRLKRPSTVLVTLSCPQSAGRCSGRITIFSIPNPRSKVKALRRERKLGRVTFSVQGGRAQTLSLPLGRGDQALLRRTGRMRVRAYATTQDSAGRTGVKSVSGTLIARTAHSSPSRA
jgi:hypothetical protein